MISLLVGVFTPFLIQGLKENSMYSRFWESTESIETYMIL